MKQVNPLHNMQTMDVMRDRYAKNHSTHTSDFVVEYNIPIPQKNLRRKELEKNMKVRMVLSSMNVNDSVACYTTEAHNTFKYAIGKLSKRENKRFTTRKYVEQSRSEMPIVTYWRTWRIK
tara:strand:+ start:294 stop:653 length:360 start_codon:yes stop_codon:yes gene_type:complete